MKTAVASKSAESDLALVAILKTEKGPKYERAFAKLYDKYHDSLLFKYRHYIKEEQVAEEVVSSAFLKAGLNLYRFDEQVAAFNTWLFKLTKNLFIDEIKKMSKKGVVLSMESVTIPNGDVLEYSVTCPDANSEQQMIKKEKCAQVKDLVENMSDKEFSELLRLRFFEELSYDEISQRTGKPIGTVKASIFRAKQAIKKDIEIANLAY